MSDAHHIGDYEIIDLIDKGAQGSIYRARYHGTPREGLEAGQIVALKRLLEEDQYFARQSDFDTELAHPNIVRYLDHFREDGFEERPCIVMEYLEGMTLEEAIRIYYDRGGLEWEKVKNLFLQCIDGFTFAYAQGIIHRDVKPSNIFICNNGEVKLIDFGVSRRTGGQTTMGGFRGTLDYMSPDYVTMESFTGDEQADIYSLGVCFFEALTGMLPFDKLGASAEFEFMGRWTGEEVPVFSLSAWHRKHKRRKRTNATKLENMRLVLHGLSAFIKRCLSADRSKRYQNFEQMHNALKKIDFQRVEGNIGHYEFFDLLGQGGFGRVYKARLVSNHDHLLAVKELLNTKNAKRFQREADLMMEYPHPNIVACLEYFEVQTAGDERMYLVMEFLEGMPGSSLRDRIRSSLKENKGKYGLDVAEALALMKHFLLGLQRLHENGVLHRDIKPANLYAPANNPENAKLLDLGIARDAASTMTKAGAPGTLDYMAPEFATKGDFKGSPGSDIYSLGMSMFEAVTGSPAFPKLSTYTEPIEVAFFKRASRPPPVEYNHPVLQANPTMQALLQKAINPLPSERYAIAKQMLNDVEKAIQGVGMDPDSVTIFTPQTQMLRSEMETVALKDAEKIFGALPARAANAPSLPPGRPAPEPGFMPPEPALPPAPGEKRRKKARSRPSHAPSQSYAQDVSHSQAMSSLKVPKQKKSAAGKVVGWLIFLTLLGGASTGYYLYRPQVDALIAKWTTPENSACQEAEQRIRSGLEKFSEAKDFNVASVTQLVNMHKDAQFGLTECPDPKWNLLILEIDQVAHRVPDRLVAQIEEQSTRGDAARTEAYLNLLTDLNGRYGTPETWGSTREKLLQSLTGAEPFMAMARERAANVEGLQQANEELASRLIGTLQRQLNDLRSLPASLQQAADLENAPLSDGTRKSLSNVVYRASRQVDAQLKKQQREISTLYRANLCEKAEVEYLKLTQYLDQLPARYFENSRTTIQAELDPDRDRCQDYVKTHAEYRAAITPLLAKEAWTLADIDRTIDNVSDLVNAAHLADRKQLVVEGDRKRLSAQLDGLVNDARNLQNSTRQSVLLKLEILLSALKRRQPDMPSFLSAAELEAHDSTVNGLLNTYLLRVTNLNTHPLVLTLGPNRNLPLLASQQSTVVPVSMQADGRTVEQSLTAKSVGFQPITRTFLPVRGGYGEIEIGGLAEFALAAPVRKAEAVVARYREHLFQVSLFSGTQVQNALRRYEDLNAPPLELKVELPEIKNSSDLPPEYRWRLQRILLWQRDSIKGMAPGKTLSDKLKLLSSQAEGPTRELLAIDQFVLNREIAATAATRQLSQDNRLEIGRIIAHNQYIYPHDYETRFKQIFEYIDRSTEANAYDYLLAIYSAYHQLHRDALNLPPAQWKAWSTAANSPLANIRTKNQTLCDAVKTCLSKMNVTEANEVAKRISDDAPNTVRLLIFLEQLTPPSHPLRSPIRQGLAGSDKEAQRARDIYRVWNITPSS